MQNNYDDNTNLARSNAMTTLHAAVADDILLHCDRTRSSEARYALNHLLWKPLNLLRIPLSADCIVASHNDILRAQESHKLYAHDGLWQCLLCQKLFRSEHFLDKHLARKHPTLRYDSGTTCLADLCGVLTPCLPMTRQPLPPVSSASIAIEDKGVFVREGSGDHSNICNDAVLKKRRVESCTEVYRHCLLHELRAQTSGTNTGVLRRIRRDLCEQAITVECVPRKDVRSVVGVPERVLRPTANRYISYYSLAAAIILVLGILLHKCCWWNEGTHLPDRKRRIRQLRRRKLKRNW